MYEIIIKRESVESITIGKRWEEVDSQPKDGHICRVMGYTPETESQQTVQREIYRQTVSELNLRAVIAAVNGMLSVE